MHHHSTDPPRTSDLPHSVVRWLPLFEWLLACFSAHPQMPAIVSGGLRRHRSVHGVWVVISGGSRCTCRDPFQKPTKSLYRCPNIHRMPMRIKKSGTTLSSTICRTILKSKLYKCVPIILLYVGGWCGLVNTNKVVATQTKDKCWSWKNTWLSGTSTLAALHSHAAHPIYSLTSSTTCLSQ